MGLALNQFRKDLRQFRYILLALAVLLVVDLASNQGWIGRANWEWPFDASDLSRTHFKWMGALIALSFILTVSCFFGNSKFRENSFLRTRPCPTRSIWLGNLLFVGVFVIVPLILTETLNLWLHELPVPLILAGTLERAMLVIPIVVIVGGLIGTAESSRSIAVFVGIAYGFGLGGAGLIGLVTEFFPHLFNGQTISSTSIRFGIVVCAAMVVVYHVWVVSLRPRNSLRVWMIAFVIFASEWAVVLGPQDAVLRGIAEAEVKTTMATTEDGSSLNLLGASLGEVREDIVQMGWRPSPKLKGMPREWFVRWGACSAELKTADGKTYQAGPYPGRTRVFRRFHNMTISEMNAMHARFSEDMVLEVQDGYSRVRSMDYRDFVLPAKGDWWDQPAELSVTGQGLAYRWELAAELKLEQGSKAKVGLSKWRILATEPRKVQNQVEIVIEREGPGLALTDQPHLVQTERWPEHRYDFVLYDPESQVGCTMRNRYVNSGKVGNHTAYQRHTAILRFEERKLRLGGWAENPEKLRLLVFRVDFLGEFEKTVKSSIVPANYRGVFRHNENISTERISQADYLQRVAELKEPASNANRAEVGNYVHSLLQLAEAFRRFNEGDPVIRRLEKLVPDHLDLFFDGLEVATSSSSRALEVALINGITPEQKDALLARLHQQPSLARVLVRRGWYEDAREQLFAELDRGQNLPHDFLVALAWFDDPRVDDRLFAELLNGNGTSAYDILSRMPRLADRLDQAIAQMWAERSRVYRSSSSLDSSIKLAARHGMVEAIDYIVRLSRLRSGADAGMDHIRMQLMGELLELPGIKFTDRYNSAKMTAAIRALGPDPKFEFDPVVRKFRVSSKGDAE